MFLIVTNTSFAFHTDCGSSDSGGPGSPPSAGGAPSLGGSRGSPTSAPIQEECEDGAGYADGRGCINDLTLYTSPSMPNISLGRPHMPTLQSAYVSAGLGGETSLRVFMRAIYFGYFYTICIGFIGLKRCLKQIKQIWFTIKYIHCFFDLKIPPSINQFLSYLSCY